MIYFDNYDVFPFLTTKSIIIIKLFMWVFGTCLDKILDDWSIPSFVLLPLHTLLATVSIYSSTILINGAQPLYLLLVDVSYHKKWSKALLCSYHVPSISIWIMRLIRCVVIFWNCNIWWIDGGINIVSLGLLSCSKSSMDGCFDGGGFTELWSSSNVTGFTVKWEIVFLCNLAKTLNWHWKSSWKLLHSSYRQFFFSLTWYLYCILVHIIVLIFFWFYTRIYIIIFSCLYETIFCTSIAFHHFGVQIFGNSFRFSDIAILQYTPTTWVPLH